MHHRSRLLLLHPLVGVLDNKWEPGGGLTMVLEGRGGAGGHVKSAGRDCGRMRRWGRSPGRAW
jgi:hypothetical protein